MAWKTLNLTTASDTGNLSFRGRGSIFVDGTFGSGTVEIYLITVSDSTGVSSVSTGSAYSIDGTTVISADVPSGDYQIVLDGSTGGDVLVWYNDQVDVAVTR